MAIKLRSIYFKNWRCYKNQKLDFNLNNSKKIWIVFGQNGFGKTSILEAIQWCLYGSDFLGPLQLLECFNRVAIKENPELDLVVQVMGKRDADEGEDHPGEKARQQRQQRDDRSVPPPGPERT